MRTKLCTFCAVLALTAAGGWVEAGESAGRAGDARSLGLPRVEIASGEASVAWSILALELGCVDSIVFPIDGTRLLLRCETSEGRIVRILSSQRPAGIDDDIGPFRGSKSGTDEIPIGTTETEW